MSERQQAGRAPRCRPAHARPSLLAPTRSVTVVGGLLAVAGLAIAGCAAVAASAATNPKVAAQPRPVRPPSVVRGTFFAGLPSSPSGSTPAAQPAPVSAGGPPWFLAEQRSLAPRHDTRQIAPRPGDSAPASALAASGIPITALQAYRQAAATTSLSNPTCGITWPLLAGIGRVESNHGRFAGAVLHSDGLSTPPVVGIPLNGNGTALITDTDGGRLDGDTVYDRAVGPMQFIPSTWAGWGVDANHDGTADPFNIFDAASAAADYLCAAGRNLRTYGGQVQAVRSYNNSDSYIALVLGVERVYAGGVGITVPIEPTNPDPGGTKPPKHHPHLPPVDPGSPPGLEHDPHHQSCVPAGTSNQPDHSASPAPSRTYQPSGPTAPHRPKPCPTHSGSSVPPPGGGHHSGGSSSSSGSTSAAPSSSSPPPTSADPTSSEPDDPSSSSESTGTDGAPSSASDSGGATDPGADAQTASSADSSPDSGAFS